MYKKILFVLVINKYNVKKIEDIYIRHPSLVLRNKKTFEDYTGTDFETSFFFF